MLAGDRLGADFDFLLRTIEADERAETLLDASDAGVSQLIDELRSMVPEKHRGGQSENARAETSHRRSGSNVYDRIREEVKQEAEAKKRGHVSAAERLDTLGTRN
jgi:peptide subunit release factor 1 (eRF1)